MRAIVIDAADWLSEDDFFDGILEALDAPDWHGRNWSALNDSIVTGSVNRVEPPYHLHLTGDQPLPEALREWVQELVALIAEARTRIAKFRSPSRRHWACPMRVERPISPSTAAS